MKSTHYMGLGVLFLFVGLELARGDIHQTITIFTMSTGLIFFLKGLRIKRYGVEEVKGDERVRKIVAWATTYSWFATLILVSSAYWMHHLKIYNLSVEGFAGLTLLFMTSTLILFRWLLLRKGDVN